MLPEGVFVGRAFDGSRRTCRLRELASQGRNRVAADGSCRWCSMQRCCGGYRSARLEQVLGARFERTTGAHLRALIESAIPEAFDLDYKRDLYGRSDADKRALATDVAALANTAGGLIIIGIGEDEQARATTFCPVELSDGEVARIRQIIGSLVSPVPTIDVHLVPEGDATGKDASAAGSTGFVMIAVARSLGAPHAVLVNDALRYPRRNGATTRYLSEPEVAEAYRGRLAGLGAQITRLDDVWAAGLARLDLTDVAWAAVALVPELAGQMRITQAVYQAFQARSQGHSAVLGQSGISIQRCTVGLGFLHADGSNDRAAALASWISYDLHTDGSGFYALCVGRTQRVVDGGTAPIVVDDEFLTVAILSGLVKLGTHAQDGAAAGGDALLRAGVWKPSQEMPTHLGHSRGYGGQTYGGAALTSPPPAAETVAAVDVLTPGPRLVATAARLCQQVGHSFGAAELGQLTEDGKILRPYFQAQRAGLEAWARSAGVEVVDTTIAG